jgi:hypothetical protein
MKKEEAAGTLSDSLKDFKRHELLPALFKISGKPFSLDDYPQFEQMYARQMAPDMIWMCGRQVAKSTNLSRSEILTSVQVPNFQTLYVAPLQSQSQRYSVLYLNEAINTCPPARMLQQKANAKELGYEGAAIVKSVMHRAFLNGSSIQLTYAKTSADRARGITSDLIDFDEIQDQLVDHIPIITESLANSDFGVRRFTGTAKTTDNTIEHYWQMSSKGEWVIKCDACGHWNMATRENNVLDMIAATGPVCAGGVGTKKGRCGAPLNVRKGHWVHAHPELVDEFPGYHIPQIVLPAMVYDIKKWSKIVDKITRLPPTTIFTEVLGISSDVGVRLITQADIDRASCLGSHKELAARVNQYAYVTLGVDWGIGEITSFTVAAVCGITYNGNIHVLYGKRYVGQDIEEVIHDINRIALVYRCDFVAPDFGVGFLNNAMLRNRGLNVVQIMYTNQNKFLSHKEMHGNSLWTVDRNTALSVTFYNVRSGRILFADKEDSGHYTSDLLSPYEELVEKSSGMSTKRFMRDPSRPDDFAHAITFAMMVLYRVTQHPILESVIPETSADYKGMDFENETEIDIQMLMQLANST